ncbi:hypothetical protein [Sporomusa sphaeroides]|uniref:hypothetical protein n=1 Tax=Sporomusa sphaeroides TaxID=47679 RepID=UPI00202F0BF8|nr:hypothetical protein [Sporomusa sphaeroides]MCM0757415.1 hypothetical protein [Sporomusa sphaeroides DSM 2875]HML33809.1 hypothetical protein [Sporomusa sphaeroides]
MIGRTELDFSEAKRFEQLFQRSGKNVVITITVDSHALDLVLDQDDFDKFIEGGQPLVSKKLEGVA